MKHSLQKGFHDFVKSHELIKKGEKVLLAVSGGLDSMVLSNLFYAEKIPFAIAHCNFHLRGSESDGDEAFVIQWAEAHTIDCYVRAFDVSGGSIQLEARNARYAWFEELMQEHDFHRLATAHHLNDSFETLLINLVRGSGIKGVEGIRMKNEKVIRPLLFATKEELRSYASYLDLSWREDSSNSRADYDRNRIRLDVVPLLEGLNPSLMETYRNTRERLQYASEIVTDRKDSIVERYFDSKENKLETGWIVGPSDQVILAAILEDFGVNYVTAKEIFNALDKPGKRFEVSDYVILVDRNSLYLTPRHDIHEKLIDAQLTKEGIYKTTFGTYEIAILERGDAHYSRDENEALFDLEKISFPLKIRPWQQGDYFIPLGMKGKKKISDLLIDHKVPVAKKAEVAVVEVDGLICWIPGFKISNLFKVTDRTKQVLLMKKTEE